MGCTCWRPTSHTTNSPSDLLDEFLLTNADGGSFHTTEVTGDKHQFEWIAESAAKEMGALFEGELPEVSNFETLNPIVSAQYGWTGEKVQALLEAYGVAGEGEVGVVRIVYGVAGEGEVEGGNQFGSFLCGSGRNRGRRTCVTCVLSVRK